MARTTSVVVPGPRDGHHPVVRRGRPGTGWRRRRRSPRRPGLLAQRGVRRGHEPRGAAADHGDPLSRPAAAGRPAAEQSCSAVVQASGWLWISRSTWVGSAVTSVVMVLRVLRSVASVGGFRVGFERWVELGSRVGCAGRATARGHGQRTGPGRHGCKTPAREVAVEPGVEERRVEGVAGAGGVDHRGHRLGRGLGRPRPPGVTAKAPAAPSLTTTSGPRAARVAAACRASATPVRATTSARFGQQQVEVGQQRVDAGPAPRRVVVGVQRRGDTAARGPRPAARPGRRPAPGCRNSEATCTCRSPAGRARLDRRRTSSAVRVGMAPGQGEDGPVVRAAQHHREPGAARPSRRSSRSTPTPAAARSAAHLVAERGRRPRRPRAGPARPSRARACAVMAAEPPIVSVASVEQLLGLAEARRDVAASAPGPGWRRRRRGPDAASGPSADMTASSRSARRSCPETISIDDRSCSASSGRAMLGR